MIQARGQVGRVLRQQQAAEVTGQFCESLGMFVSLRAKREHGPHRTGVSLAKSAEGNRCAGSGSAKCEGTTPIGFKKSTTQDVGHPRWSTRREAGGSWGTGWYPHHKTAEAACPRSHPRANEAATEQREHGAPPEAQQGALGVGEESRHGEFDAEVVDVVAVGRPRDAGAEEARVLHHDRLPATVAHHGRRCWTCMMRASPQL